MSFHEALTRFRAWQREPLHYEDKSHDTVRCKNCGTEFVTNFCPVCGQKTGIDRVTWKTVQQGIMMLWGIDSRSLGYTLLQLMGRPGYLIRDYISGKRQMSFPPVKMLLLVALVLLLVEQLIGIPIVETSEEDRDFIAIEALNNWVERSPGWGAMVYCGFLLLPTWLFFRFAPRYPKHTLPEGFFIQVFMATILLIISVFCDIISYWLGWFYLVYYLIAYHQLFGYGWWGTTWRLLLTIFEGIVIMLTIAFAYEHIVTKAPVGKRSLAFELTSAAVFHVINIAFLLAFYYISNKNNRKVSPTTSPLNENKTT